MPIAVSPLPVDIYAYLRTKRVRQQSFRFISKSLLQTIAFHFNGRSARRRRITAALRFAAAILFGSHSVTDASAVRFSLTLARAIINARPFEAEAALIVVRDLAYHAPAYLLVMSQAAEDAILAAQGRLDSSVATVAREALDRFVTEMECHAFAEQPASRD